MILWLFIHCLELHVSYSKLLVLKGFVKWRDQQLTLSYMHKLNTGQPCYVKLAYLEYTVYVKVIIHSPSISPILLCISNLFLSNLVITKSRLYQSGFSFPKISFQLLYHYLCRSKFCVGQKIKQYECQTK